MYNTKFSQVHIVRSSFGVHMSNNMLEQLPCESFKRNGKKKLQALIRRYLAVAATAAVAAVATGIYSLLQKNHTVRSLARAYALSVRTFLMKPFCLYFINERVSQKWK